jgi:hypothetical protein
MIRRDANNAWVLISQVDHAHLAADLASAWGNDEVAPLPLTEWLLPAIRDHDAGWRAWEEAPTITDDGLPRQFMEMSAEDSEAIWTESIAISAAGTPSLADALRRMRADGGEVTPDDAAVLDELVRSRKFASADRLQAELLRGTDLTEAAIDASLQRLERRGLLRLTNQPLGGDAIQMDLAVVGASPLGGIWVSRHFTSLAEQSCESKAAEDRATAPLRRFLSDQEFLQRVWLNAVKDFAGDELERVADTGFRFVQFFDRISLWLCTADLDEAWEATLSSKLAVRFTPRTAQEIVVEPWPFRTPAIELSVPAIAIEAAPLTSDAALRHVVKSAERRTLRWVLVRA